MPGSSGNDDSEVADKPAPKKRGRPPKASLSTGDMGSKGGAKSGSVAGKSKPTKRPSKASNVGEKGGDGDDDSDGDGGGVQGKKKKKKLLFPASQPSSFQWTSQV